MPPRRIRAAEQRADAAIAQAPGEPAENLQAARSWRGIRISMESSSLERWLPRILEHTGPYLGGTDNADRRYR